MKVGLSHHQSVCVSPHQKLLNRLVDIYEILHDGNAIQGDLDAIIFNPVPSIILK
jgi:hypothetical protein